MKIKLESQKVKIIQNSKGNIFKLLSKKSKLFVKFGEIYLSEVKVGKFKGWKYNEKYTQLLTVVKGSVEFKFKKGSLKKTKTISFPKNLSIIKVPPKTHYSFKCKNSSNSIILNLTDRLFK